ncbi:MAG: DUF4087 domain-containing protein, partial [Deltaproteobacteria bacterium]|nr:DUF4087 domain-containing protein [Deltaproteobacteria bacterium]
MKRVLFLWCFVFVVLSLNNNLFSSEKYETRCGWIDNPTPANWDLTDRDRTWTIGVQGGVQAEGD